MLQKTNILQTSMTPRDKITFLAFPYFYIFDTVFNIAISWWFIYGCSFIPDLPKIPRMFATGRKTVEKEQDIIIITAMSTLKILRNLIHSKKKEDIPRAVVCTLKSPHTQDTMWPVKAMTVNSSWSTTIRFGNKEL